VHVPFLLCFVSLELFDRFNLFSAVPMMIATGFHLTAVYQRARGLEVPLWYSKQVSRFSVLYVLAVLFMGYCMLSRNMQTNESRVVLQNM